jgi:hypothetical protein
MKCQNSRYKGRRGRKGKEGEEKRTEREREVVVE